jgi:pectate lyase
MLLRFLTFLLLTAWPLPQAQAQTEVQAQTTAPTQARPKTLAFPGAEGFGATATGGRGKPAVAVTNLDDDGPGSFRSAVSHDGAMVVFRVSGIIHLKSNLELGSDLTIAGQTAPGSGITIADAKVSMTHAHNIIIRYMRFRGGLAESPKVSSINLSDAAHVMLDHLSIEWGRWDNIQTNGNTYSTIQNSIIGQGIVPQRFGCLCESDYLTLSHNLWIDNKSRNPKGKGHIQYVNNVVYNWGVTGYVGGHGAADHYADLVGNYFIAGPDSSPNFIGEFTRTDHTYMSGNYVDTDRNGHLDGRMVTSEDLEHANGDALPQPFAHPAVPVRIEPATSLIPHLAIAVGDNLCRDRVDQHLIDELLSFGVLGKLIADETEVGGLPPQVSGVAPQDTDDDGIPDVWEKLHKLNPKDSADGRALDPATGYSHLEQYLNDLVEKTACSQ